MEWLSSVRKQAAAAVDSALHSEAAERARELAAQAKQQAAALAKEASAKAQEVAKEALGEAEKSLAGLRQGQAAGRAADPGALGITPELLQFVRSLTYSTFSDYPLDSLDLPPDPAAAKLTPWQEGHARAVLEQVQQLQDLRFVLCPKVMDEHVFWLIYFTLCRRYLPEQAQERAQHCAGAGAAPQQPPQQPPPPPPQPAPPRAPSISSVRSASPAPAPAPAAVPAAAAAAAAATAAATAGAATAATAAAAAGPDASAGLPLSSSAPDLARESGGTQAAAAGGGSPEPPAAEAGAAAGGAGADADAEFAALVGDPDDLDAYLQSALQLKGEGGESDIEDLDEYLTQLGAGERG
ncbi:hypothetical protein HT031_004802 [Scenedesmus sp. PABB004]|nr:hypothetical protein HT031_004802 [Scenedesmus sp. PABB004]